MYVLWGECKSWTLDSAGGLDSRLIFMLLAKPVSSVGARKRAHSSIGIMLQLERLIYVVYILLHGAIVRETSGARPPATVTDTTGMFTPQTLIFSSYTVHPHLKLHATTNVNQNSTNVHYQCIH